MGYFENMLAKKYDIMQQGANAQTMEARARANLLNQQASVIGAGTRDPGPSMPVLGFGGNDVGYKADPMIDPIDEQLKLAEIALKRQQGMGLRSAASVAEDRSLLEKKAANAISSGQLGVDGASDLYDLFVKQGLIKASPGLKKGIARVPGKGDGTKDTVKAKLAPGEAVLNKAAAENLGRGLIAVLNQQGAVKMGMT